MGRNELMVKIKVDVIPNFYQSQFLNHFKKKAVKLFFPIVLFEEIDDILHALAGCIKTDYLI